MSRFWQHFVSNGKGGCRCEPLGITGHTIPVAACRQRPLPLGQEQGVEVWDLMPDSSACRAGLASGDVILRLEGQPTTTVRHLDLAIEAFRARQLLSIVILRDGVLDERTIRLKGPAGRHRGGVAGDRL